MQPLTQQIATQLREQQLNGHWIATNLKEHLSDVTWEEATTKIGSLNTIAALTFHLNYYIDGVLKVLKGGSLDIRDKFSYDMAPITSQADWDALREKSWRDVEEFVLKVEQMPEEKLWQGFVDEKYGNYYRNLLAIVEHSYYHIGQIVLIKKMIRNFEENVPIVRP